LVGIAGDSASGKSTFAKGIVQLFGEENVLSITLDNYHKFDRKERKDLGITPLNPLANDFDLIYEHLKSLKSDKSIMMPVYDHSNGTFDSPVKVEPKEIVVVEGLHPFYQKRIHQLFNITIFIDPAFEIRKEWKIKRDVEQRGYRYEDVIREIDLRLPDYRKYVEPQKRKAEIIIQIRKDRSKREYKKGSPYWIRIFQLITGERLSKVYFPLNLSSMCELEAEEMYFEYRKVSRGKRKFSVIEFNGTVRRESLKDVEKVIKRVANREGDIFEGEIVTETDVGKFIIAWRVAERFKELKKG